jgi:hypothetical protein
VAFVMLAVATAAIAAQSPEPPLSDTRLTVHTLLREDVFAGFLSNDMARFERAERNVAALLEQRPSERGNLLAWQGGMRLFRAVRANDAGQPRDSERLYAEAREFFAAANRTESGNEAVPAIVGGSLVLFADRLPQPQRATAWAQAYDAYAILWKAQAPAVDKIPVHFRGELLAGLAQSAQRTGRADESAQWVDKMLVLLQNTPYEATARQWKEQPASAATSRVACKSCHEPGRLAPTIGRMSKPIKTPSS